MDIKTRRSTLTEGTRLFLQNGTHALRQSTTKQKPRSTPDAEFATQQRQVPRCLLYNSTRSRAQTAKTKEG